MICIISNLSTLNQKNPGKYFLAKKKNDEDAKEHPQVQFLLLIVAFIYTIYTKRKWHFLITFFLSLILHFFDLVSSLVQFFKVYLFDGLVGTLC